MADGKKQRSAKLVNLALNPIEKDNSFLKTSNRQVSNAAVCDSSQTICKKRARSLSAQVQHTPEFSFSDSQKPSTSQAKTFYLPHKKRARSISTHVKPASNIESLNLSQGDIILSSMSTDQNWIRQRARVLSTQFEYETHTESYNELEHAGSVKSPIHNIQGSNMDVTSSHLRKLKITIPILHTKRYTSESALRQFSKSAVQFTSSSGPLRSWISQTKIINPKVMVLDIVKNYNPITDNSQQYHLINVGGTLSAPINSEINIEENAGKSIKLKIGEKENILPCSSKLSTRDSDTSRQSSYPTDSDLFSEPVLSGLNDIQEKTRRCVRVRGGKFGSSYISKEMISDALTANIETISEDEKPQNIQGRPRKRVRTRGGKSFSASTSNINTTNVEEELTAITGTPSEHESLPNVSENTNLPISEEQLLQILEDSDEYDDNIFDDDFIENMNNSDNDSDTSIASEDEIIPRNTEEDQEWSNHHRQTRRINFEGNPVGLKIQPEGSEPIDYFNLVVTNNVFK